MLQIQPLHALFAARVTGVTVRDGVPEAAFAAISPAGARD
jgi:hypothetical protein